MSWWERHPGELEREIEELKAAGMAPKLNEEFFAQGKVEIGIRITIFGRDRDGIVTYPDLYPYFRPMLLVRGLGSDLRHYNPYSGEVCLLQRGTRYWRPELTAAQHIVQMLPHWEQAAVRKYADQRLVHEDGQAEPSSVYIPPMPGQSVILDSSWCRPVGTDSGTMTVAVKGGRKALAPLKSCLAWVTEVGGIGGKNTWGVVDADIRGWIESQGYNQFNISWKYIDAIPVARDQRELILALLSANPDVDKHINTDLKCGRSGLYGLCFPEEDPNGGSREGWMFLAYRYDGKMIRAKQGSPIWALKVEYSGSKDLFQRIPELHPIRQKTVAVIGLGCVGAPSVLAFARAGVGELRLLDGDHVSPGTICRWPLGLPVLGTGKVKALTEFVRQNYPLTRIGTNHLEGGGDDDGFLIGACDYGVDQWDCLEKMLSGADLVYDATAEQGINILLADLAAKHGIPYIAASSRAGGWGGDVLRIRPGKTEGCYYCSLTAFRTGDIAHPPYDPVGDQLQPVGCGDVTFTAAGFDVEEVSLAGVRLAVSTLCEGAGGGYPPTSDDIGILFLRESGESIFPQWRSYPLHKHPACPWCNK